MIMSEADVIGRRTGEASPLLKARIAGVLYLIIIVTAGFAEGFVRDKLVVGSDADCPETTGTVLQGSRGAGIHPSPNGQMH